MLVLPEDATENLTVRLSKDMKRFLHELSRKTKVPMASYVREGLAHVWEIHKDEVSAESLIRSQKPPPAKTMSSTTRGVVCAVVGIYKPKYLCFVDDKEDELDWLVVVGALCKKRFVESRGGYHFAVRTAHLKTISGVKQGSD